MPQNSCDLLGPTRGTLKGICGSCCWHCPVLIPMNATLALDVLDLAARQNLVLSVSLAYLWSDGVCSPAGGGQHCQEGLRLRCRNILIGAICTAKITSGYFKFSFWFMTKTTRIFYMLFADSQIWRPCREPGSDGEYWTMYSTLDSTCKENSRGNKLVLQILLNIDLKVNVQSETKRPTSNILICVL